MSYPLLQFSNLVKNFSNHILFEDITLTINQGDLLALIGENGVGKTTLLQILLERIQPDAGHFIKKPGLSIGFLPQEIVLVDSSISLRRFLEIDNLSELEELMADCLANERLNEWEKIHEQYERLGGYKSLPLEQILKGLKLENFLLDQPMLSLSSGQRIRAALAKVLMENPDLLLLDEPTNHLDKDMILWLQSTLKKREGASLIVSHDRKFLNESCNRLIEIKNCKLNIYSGNYDFYLAEQDRILDRELKAFKAYQEEKNVLTQKIKAASFSQAKPPPPKDNNKIGSYDKRGEKHQKSLKHQIDVMKNRLEEIENNPLSHPKPKTIKGIHFIESSLESSTVIELEQISKSFNNKILFKDFSSQIFKGDRIIITGPNGCGKTTLLKIIAGLIPPDSGQIHYTSSSKIAFLDQDINLLPMGQTPLEYFEIEFNLLEVDLRSELHKAALGCSDIIKRPFSTLSTGQRKHLVLLAMILQKPNVLLLDEPTNHLDFITLEALEKALLNFKGVVIAVSHDRTFIEKIATHEWKLQ